MAGKAVEERSSRVHTNPLERNWLVRKLFDVETAGSGKGKKKAITEASKNTRVLLNTRVFVYCTDGRPVSHDQNVIV